MALTLDSYDVKKNCRVCLLVSSEMVSLFASEGVSYGDMLTNCSRVSVKENDRLPCVMCKLCVKKMVDANDFIVKSRESDKRLRLYLTKEEILTVDIKDEPDDHISESSLDDFPLSHDFEIKDIKDDSDDHVDDFKEKTLKTGKKKWRNKEHKIKTLRKKKTKASNVENRNIKHNESLDDKKADYSLDKCKDLKIEQFNVFVTVEKLKHKRHETNSDGLKKKKSKASPLKCKQCGLLVRSKSAMLIHLATHSDERPFECANCGKSYRSRGNLKKHIVTSHSSSDSWKFKCVTCNRAFHCNSELVTHYRTHTGDTPYQCEWCPKAFSQLSTLTRHRLTHTGEKPFQCAVCGKKFSTRDNLKNHMLVHTSEKKFACKVCGILLKTRGSLAKHQLLHTNFKSFVCDQCGHSFRTKGNLKLHMDKKHSERSGYCTICSKRFSDIEEHNNIHTGKTPFQCAMCNKKYGVKRSLLVHMRKHDNPEKYSCEYEGCLKKFPIKCMLEFHVLKYHKKQTPYVCSLCQRGFFRLNDLNLHKKMNHLCMMETKTSSENKHTIAGQIPV